MTRLSLALALGLFASACSSSAPPPPAAAARTPASLWEVYDQTLKSARYVDLTHTMTPTTPLWAGFGPSTFGRTIDPKTGKPYTFEKEGFEATTLTLSTDQYGTQLDPPAHWNPDYPTIDELPATFTIRPLVVISIVDQVSKDPGYHLQVADIDAWEKAHGRIPEGAVVFVRSDWSKDWPDPALSTRTPFPGVSLAALKFLHLERHILFHGHEPLDTDTTPTLEGESWLLNNGYTQAEGVDNLDEAPESGALVAIGYPKVGGGLGGFARFIAICPPDWKYGVSIGQIADSPLAKSATRLHWDEARGMRVR